MGENNVTALQVAPGVLREVLASGVNLTLVRFRFAAGADLPPHQHVHEQASFVLKGKMRLIADSREIIMKEGDSLLIPPNVPHSAACIEDAVVLDSFSPPREDFLPAK